ncbi:MAG: hypothetical protein K6L75_08840 [Cellvibrionaceae bacterium]
MSGEVEYARKLIEKAMTDTCSEKGFDKDNLGRAMINTVIDHFREYRTVKDIRSELEYLVDNLDEDEFVITRGC